MQKGGFSCRLASKSKPQEEAGTFVINRGFEKCLSLYPDEKLGAHF